MMPWVLLGFRRVELWFCMHQMSPVKIDGEEREGVFEILVSICNHNDLVEADKNK